MALFKLDHAEFCPEAHTRQAQPAKPDVRLRLDEFSPDEWAIMRLATDEVRSSRRPATVSRLTPDRR